MAENNNTLVALLAFAAGIAVGANWDKIKATVAPVISSFTEKGTKFMAEQKENVEDNIAAAKIASAKKSLQAQEPVSTEASGSSSPEKMIIRRKKPSQV